MASPFKPSKDDNYDKKNSESEWKDMNEDGLQHCLELLQKESVQELFVNYEYDENHQPIRRQQFRTHSLDYSHCNRISNSFCGSNIFQDQFCNFKTTAANDR